MVCEICGESIRSNGELRIHLLSNHGVAPADYFKVYASAKKFCSKCKRELSVAQFFVDRSNQMGYRTRCINCLRPEGKKGECPFCHRIFLWAAVATHLKTNHGILLGDAYREHLKEKYCPRCGQLKPLINFYRLTNSTSSYFSYCRACNTDRLRRRRRA